MVENFSANFPPHYHILAINCVHASNWFTHLQRPRQIDGQKDNSVLTEMHACSVVESIPKQHGFGRYSTKTPWYIYKYNICSRGRGYTVHVYSLRSSTLNIGDELHSWQKHPSNPILVTSFLTIEGGGGWHERLQSSQLSVRSVHM